MPLNERKIINIILDESKTVEGCVRLLIAIPQGLDGL